MGRAPCCEEMGLKKGPWTREEDQILVDHINRFGHGNWRALPKQAGLLRCGKSCRLRWRNYLRPDIKRGNFSREEEDMIINLHEMLGNRWSAIAARLPGRTDNEIKNVWHTHLKKRPSSNHAVEGTKNLPTIVHANSHSSVVTADHPSSSAGCSSSDLKDEYVDFSPQELQEIIDESFWNEALSMENCSTAINENVLQGQGFSEEWGSNSSSGDEDADFWLGIFKEAEDLFGLPDL